MKNNLSKLLLLLSLTLGFGLSGALGETKYACSEIGKKAKASVAAKPSSASSVVSKLITQYEDCVCAIVKGAIEAGGDVKSVVTAAVKVAPTKSAVVHECAVSVAPKSAKLITDSIAELLEDPDFGTDPIVVSGVYLIAPVASGGVGTGLVRQPSVEDLLGPLSAEDLEFLPQLEAELSTLALSVGDNEVLQQLLYRLLDRLTETPSTPTDPQ